MTKLEIVAFKKTVKARMNELENRILTDKQYAENDRQYWDKNSKKFEV